MNNNEVHVLESYFKTENEHWNEYVFEMLCEILKQGNFQEPETALQLFDKSVNIFTKLHATPLNAIQEFDIETERVNINIAQRLFVYERVYKYLRFTEFEGKDLAEVKELLKSHIHRLKNKKLQSDYNKPLTGNIRDTLKEMMQKEIESLPETFKELSPIQRLNILCKLIPFVLPKVESITHSLGEPEDNSDKVGLNW